ncbi:MAG: Npt1/Npt2 family nucleotide transporter [Bryobacteraceae bacterium]|nr:Npt1/Npt2 family nucleotide transporter [Bryobacteraceae bacterium]
MVERPEYQSRPEIKSYSSFPAFRTLGEKPKGPLEKFLSIFADVRAGEGFSVLVLAINVFLLLFAYYLLKTVREALILSEGGATVKSYSAAAQALVLIAMVPVYGWLGSKVVRIRLLTGLTLFFVMNLAVFAIIGATGAQLGVAFYIWVGVFNVFAISQFWAFANDLYTEAQGKRLFPFIGVGSSLGAWLGARAAAELVKAYQLTPFALMWIGAGLLLVCVGLTWLVNRRESRAGTSEMAQHADKALGAQDGFKLIFSSRYLTLIAVLIVLLNIVNSCGEFLLGNVVTEQAAALPDRAAKQRFIGEFYGNFFSWVNAASALMQMFVVSRLFQAIGVRGSLFVLPSIAMVSYSVLAVAPLLAVVRVAKIFENSTDYSVQNTVRQALFLPTSREAKYKAKAAIDTFFMRFGDVLQAGVVKVGTEIGAGLAGFAWFNVALTLGWLWIAARLSREHRRLSF